MMQGAEKRVIVTGATSFIAAALIDRLLSQGYEVTAVIRPGSDRRHLLESRFWQLKIVEHELNALESLRLEGRYAYFVHIGWITDFENARYHLSGQLQNVACCEEAVRLAVRLGCQVWMGIGSQAECGIVERRITPDTKDNPQTAYAAAKCRAYESTKSLCRQYGIKHCWPRILSAYGPGDRDTTLIMACMKACVAKTILPMTPAQQIWDYVYADKVAEALQAILERGIDAKKYTIASGEGRMLVSYIEQLSDVMGFPELMEGIGKKEYASDQVMYLVGDVTDLQREFGIDMSYHFGQGIRNIKNSTMWGAGNRA